MIYSEEEALKKQCCADPQEWCCATRCMAWRWHRASCLQIDPDYEWKEPATTATAVMMRGEMYKEAPREQWRGYCGLVGEP